MHTETQYHEKKTTATKFLTSCTYLHSILLQSLVLLQSLMLVEIGTTNILCTFCTKAHMPFYDPFSQVHLGELVLSQRRDLLKQLLDFYESDVLPATRPIVSKHYRKSQWFGRLLFYRHGISTPCLTNSVKALKETFCTNAFPVILGKNHLTRNDDNKLNRQISQPTTNT